MTRVGPGRLVLVVGPSGAGKDTLLDLARAMLRNDASVVFSRRVVTRAAAGEPHDTMDPDAFERANYMRVLQSWQFDPTGVLMR